MADAKEQVDQLTAAIKKTLLSLRAIGNSIDVECEADQQLLEKISQCHDELKTEARSTLGLDN